jgi:Golgi phosphoprotein 3 (GPP34)
MVTAGTSVQVVLIAEMWLLCVINDRGRVPRRPGVVKAGVSAALLAELAIGGHLTMAKGGYLRAGDHRPGDELLADAYDAVRNHLNGLKVRTVIFGLSRHVGGSRNRVADRLADAGVLGRSRVDVLLQIRHPIVNPAVRQAVLEYLRNAAMAAGPLPPDATVVLTIAGSCRLLKQAVPDRRARLQARRQMVHADVQPPFRPDVAPIVKEILQQVGGLARSYDSPYDSRTG